MYTNPRPVPSKGALRVLRQLAYISSGTVAGAAGLVLEERRRKTCVAKKIVDNAKQLRQHPRYRHNVAAQRLQEMEFSPFETYMGYEMREGGGRGDGSADGRRVRYERYARQEEDGDEMLYQPDAPRSEVLPSRVDRGYSRWSRRQQHEPTSRSSVDIDRTGQRPQRDKVPSMPSWRERPAGTANEHIKPATTIRSSAAASSSSTTISHKRSDAPIPTTPAKTPSPENAGHCAARWQKAFVGYRSYFRKRTTDPTTGADIDVPRWKKIVQDGLPGAVDAFVAQFTVAGYEAKHDPIDPDGPKLWQHGLAEELLDIAVTQHRFEDGFRVCQWLHDWQGLGSGHIQSLIAGVKQQAANITGGMRSTVGELVSQVMSADLAETDDTSSDIQILDMIISSSRDERDKLRALSTGHKSPADALAGLCTEHIQSRRSSHALELYKYGSVLLDELQDRTAVSTQVMRAAIEKKAFVFAQNLTLYTNERQPDLTESALQVIADSEMSPSALKSMYKSLSKMIKLPEALHRRYFLQRAKSDKSSDALQALLYLRLPYDNEVLGLCERHWPDLLFQLWHRTRNFEATFETFCNMRELAGPGNISIDVYSVMLRICAEGNRTERMQTLLAELKDRDALQADAESYCAWMLVAARQQDWSRFEDMRRALQAEDVSSSKVRTSTVENLLKTFASHHTSDEVLDLSYNLISHLQVGSQKMVLKIMTEVLIREGNITRLVEMVTNFKSLGKGIEITPDYVLKVFKDYYSLHRPTYAWIGHLIRQVAYGAKHLLSTELIQFHMSAIGVGIRAIAGWHTRRAHREKAQESLEASKRYLAWKSNQAFPGRDNSNTKTRISLELAEEIQEPTTGKMATASQMLYGFSLGKSETAVKFYKKSLAANGLPQSHLSLDVAVQASLQAEGGGQSEALKIIDAASSAGMDTTSALIPLYINRYQQVDQEGNKAVQHWREVTAEVLEFYERMDKNGIPVSHHLATSAASAMLQFGYSRSAAHLMHQVVRSPWGKQAQQEIVFMTVKLRAHVAHGDIVGAEKTIAHVLDAGLRIDRKFTDALLRGTKYLDSQSDQLRRRDRLQAQQDRLSWWRGKCLERRQEQSLRTKKIGEELVEFLVANAERPKQEDGELGFNIREEHTYARWDKAGRWTYDKWMAQKRRAEQER